MWTLKAGSRPSPLAIKQVEEISSLLPGIAVKVIPIETKGDLDKGTPLSKMEGTDFFTREIEEALISGRIDAAIHSAKDLEDIMPGSLIIAAITGSIGPYDCLISRRKETLKTLAAGAVVGTSSRKRKEAILKFRSDLIVKDIRGNIDERLAQFDRGDFDAVIVAHAAIIRLGYEAKVAQVIPKEIIEPHPLQGRLAIQIRSDRHDLIEIFKELIDAN